MSATAIAPEKPDHEAPPPEPEAKAPIPRWALVLGVIALWFVGWLFTKGTHTLELAGTDITSLHERLSGFRDAVLRGRDSSWLVQFTYGVGGAFNGVVDWLQRMISIPDFPRPVPQIGWLGVTAFATWLASALAGFRSALLVLGSFLAFGLIGYWSDSMDLLIITIVSVIICFVIGLPMGILMAHFKIVNTVVSTLLDIMQTFPTFVYLAPVALFFGIGSSSAVVLTLLYALPPIMRITAHGISSVSPATIEATDSFGQTAWQRLAKVELPMARRTIVVGLNQTTLAALSMATLASFVDGPGLGRPVLDALIKNDVGGAFVPGVLIVVMAIMLDRTTTAASQRREILTRSESDPKRRRLIFGALAVVMLVCVYLSRTYPWAAQFPTTTVGRTLVDGTNSFFGWINDNLDNVTEAIANFISYGLLNPMQSLLADSPWWLTGLALLAIAWILGGVRGGIAAAVCLLGIYLTDLWNPAMITLTMCLVGILITMVLAVVIGVWMGRSNRADLFIRPLLDAGQTIPPFVYLIPVLGLFGPTRFTAIVAAVVYAAPVAIKLVADGIRGVPETTIEASRSTGTTSWQEIRGVQLPMAKSSLVLATNQGLLYVLSMVVIGGMVGAGALGYDVVHGFARSEYWGRGFAAGLAIALLGIMVDRIARGMARRQSN